MRDDGEHFGGAVRGAERGRGGKRAARVGHVVDQDGGSGGYRADEDHAADFVRARALFVD